MTVFAEGTKASYKGHVGVIEFICDEYLTLCICTFPNEKSRNVCIIIYPSDFNKIKLTKESEK
jgi:hypothetical protein